MFSRCLLSLLMISSAASAAIPSTECRLNGDQGKGSFAGSWEKLPVTLVLDRDFYAEYQGKNVQALKRAVQTWNNWAKLKGKVAFVLAHDGVGDSMPNLNSCSQQDFTRAVPSLVGVWKLTSQGNRANSRPSCGTNPDGSYRKILEGIPAQTDWRLRAGKIVGASVMLNFDEYNSFGRDDMDVESTFLHELGHVLGLLHSCSGAEGDAADPTTAPLCSKAPEEYRRALMAPFHAGDFRRSLEQNDYDRVNCLY